MDIQPSHHYQSPVNHPFLYDGPFQGTDGESDAEPVDNSFRKAGPFEGMGILGSAADVPLDPRRYKR